MATQHLDVLECARTNQKTVKNLKESCPNSLCIWITSPDMISSLKLVNQTWFFFMSKATTHQSKIFYKLNIWWSYFKYKWKTKFNSRTFCNKPSRTKKTLNSLKPLSGERAAVLDDQPLISWNRYILKWK